MMGLGDRIEQALSMVGITQERVERWLGKECGCEERKQKLNNLGRWAYRVFLGKPRGREYLEGMMSEVDRPA